MSIAPESDRTINTSIVEKDRQLKEQNIQGFFNNLKMIYPINKVYYPGPGVDSSLNGVFKNNEVTYIDKDPYFDGVLKGDFRKTELPDNSHDALFLQDIHHSRQMFPELLRVVKSGGLVVVSMYGCGLEPPTLMRLPDYETHPQLKA
ncbi:MAG: methyltransferase domain-containing protein, partial [Candidatus Levybacteria bacterium]|nr:methyltransferase domain-containing protein [Candidatus Levybacteria bacterium]